VVNQKANPFKQFWFVILKSQTTPNDSKVVCGRDEVMLGASSLSPAVLIM